METSSYDINRKKWTQEEFEQYVKELDAIGKEERIQEGAFELGIKKGIQQGIEQGKQREAEKIAIKLLQEGMNIDFIVKTTGLSIEQIEQLHKNIKN